MEYIKRYFVPLNNGEGKEESRIYEGETRMKENDAGVNLLEKEREKDKIYLKERRDRLKRREREEPSKINKGREIYVKRMEREEDEIKKLQN